MEEEANFLLFEIHAVIKGEESNLRNGSYVRLQNLRNTNRKQRIEHTIRYDTGR